MNGLPNYFINIADERCCASRTVWSAMNNKPIYQAVSSRPVRQAVAKVPEITALFWVTKILTTAMGEATSDTLAHGLGPFLAVGIGFIVFAAALFLQFSVKKYIAGVYWLAVAMVAVFGTMAADGLHIELGIPYLLSSTFFATVLILIFIAWYAVEHTLSIHSIFTRRREFFYWATVVTTFALGTAAGDMTATTLHLGYLTSGIVFALLFALPAVAYLWFGAGEVLTFWIAYILTRPLGASFADWFAVSRSRGGLAWGTLPVALSLTALIVVAVAYLTVTREGVNRHRFSLGRRRS